MKALNMDAEYKISSSKLEKLPIVDGQCCVNLAKIEAARGGAEHSSQKKRGQWTVFKGVKLIFLAEILFAILAVSFAVSLICLIAAPGSFSTTDSTQPSTAIEETLSNIAKKLNSPYSYQSLLNDLTPELRAAVQQTRRKRSVPCSQNAEHCKSVVDSMWSLVNIVNDSMPHLQSLLKNFTNDGSKSQFLELVECLQCKSEISNSIIDQTTEIAQPDQIKSNVKIISDLLNEGETNTTVNVVEFLNKTVKEGSVHEKTDIGDWKVAVFGEKGVDEAVETTTFEEAAHSNATTEAVKMVEEEKMVNGTKGIEDSTQLMEENVTVIPSSVVHPSRQGYEEEEQLEGDSLDASRRSNSRGGSQSRIYSNDNYQSKGSSDMVLVPTAETMKSTQQLQVTPTMSWMPYQVCFYGPSNGGGKQSAPGSMTYPVSSPGASYPVSMPQQRPGFKNQMPNYVQVQAQSVQFYPGNSGAQKTGPTGPGMQNPPMFPGHQSSPSGSGSSKSLYYCTYIPAPTFQFPAIPGVSEYQRSSKQQSEPQDVLRRQELEKQKTFISELFGACPFNMIRCGDGKRCILRSQWCDGQVNCNDASDETTCSCRDRISQEKLCDGYFDCPHGEDELGCLGCSKTSFSCNDWTRRYSSDNCVPLSQRCDGIRQCPNGKDEMDCNILTPSYIEGENVFTIGFTEGYHHKNYKGQWYPVCTAVDSWVRDVCASEVGPETSEMPAIQIRTIPENAYRGSYIAEVQGQIKLVPSCFDSAIYVRCPRFPCGTRISSRQDSLRPHVVESNGYGLRSHEGMQLQASGNSSKNPEDQILGVVGGRTSQPEAWPFLVAIYKDGNFFCGGVILNELWILTAAHCLDDFSGHYYEIQAGMLRRFSFSPMSQTRKARYTIMHPLYNVSDMQNDIGLIMLDSPLRFNRWVRPVCLPAENILGAMWRRKPEVNTTCIAIGWGATREHGPDPDHLREVEVPILKNCKYETDENEGTICAGYPQGGRDACQGDSGGPLLCRNPYAELQWYVAGIVSHGEGCGRPDEPGAYTKVSYFLNWIQATTSGRGVPLVKKSPLDKCPGFSCEGGLGKCLPIEARCNKIVDCLDGEDEVNCHGHLNYLQYRQMSDLNTEFDLINPTTSTTSQLPNIIDQNATTVTNDAHSATTKDPINEVDFTNTDETTATSNETVTTTESLPTSAVYQTIFTCARLLQSISIDKRCDRKVDCEDGTDEMNCTCKDYLLRFKPTAICNGFLDCADRSDEENCEFCKEDKFYCKESKECIDSSKKCDGKFDCQHKEDEVDCFTLSDGKNVYLDADERPLLNFQGVLTRHVKGKWRSTCHRPRIHQNQSTAILIGQNMCEYFGFANLASSEEVTVRDSELETIAWNEENSTGHGDSPVVPPGNNEATCPGLHIRCKPVLKGFRNTHSVVDPTTESRDYLWPWIAAIFVDGSYRCSAILLDRDWLLSAAKCVEHIRLDQNYTTAVLGYGPMYHYVDGPYQQVSVVDEVQRVNNSMSVLLHLKDLVNITRHVRPLFLEKKIYLPGINDTCVAVGTDSDYKTKSIFLRPSLQNCQSCYRCFVNASISECSENQESDWSGTIFCNGRKGWYPAAAFQDKNGPCSFRNVQTLTSIDHINPYLMEAIDGTRKSLEAKCNGFRCNIGKCIPQKQVCDGVPQCRGREDEDPMYCEQQRENCENSVEDCNCSKTELRCRNGKCVDKSSFCDGNIDCTDGSDEPAICTCAEYLKLTAPQRLCDGVRHCLDKTDESPEMCPCKETSFQCKTIMGNNTCIPQDFICDENRDCLDGADEATCTMLKHSSNDSAGSGEVIRRSYGVWHSECLPQPITSEEAASNLCGTLGYLSGALYNVSNITEEPVVPKRDDFYMVKINNWTWMTLRDDKPLISLVKPQECHRAFVTCV